MSAALEREEILSALHRRLQTLPHTVRRNEAAPVGAETTLLVLHDGDPGKPEVLLSPVSYSYEHRAEIDAVQQGSGDHDADFAHLLADVGRVIAEDRTLGGRCDWVEALAPQPAELSADGAPPTRAATIPVILHYATSDALA